MELVQVRACFTAFHQKNQVPSSESVNMLACRIIEVSMRVCEKPGERLGEVKMQVKMEEHCCGISDKFTIQIFQAIIQILFRHQGKTLKIWSEQKYFTATFTAFTHLSDKISMNIASSRWTWLFYGKSFAVYAIQKRPVLYQTHQTGLLLTFSNITTGTGRYTNARNVSVCTDMELKISASQHIVGSFIHIYIKPFLCWFENVKNLHL